LPIQTPPPDRDGASAGRRQEAYVARSRHRSSPVLTAVAAAAPFPLKTASLAAQIGSGPCRVAGQDVADEECSCRRDRLLAAGSWAFQTTRPSGVDSRIIRRSACRHPRSPRSRGQIRADLDVPRAPQPAWSSRRPPVKRRRGLRVVSTCSLPTRWSAGWPDVEENWRALRRGPGTLELVSVARVQFSRALKRRGHVEQQTARREPVASRTRSRTGSA